MAKIREQYGARGTQTAVMSQKKERLGKFDTTTDTLRIGFRK
jgi:hypothetical protein